MRPSIGMMYSIAPASLAWSIGHRAHGQRYHPSTTTPKDGQGPGVDLVHTGVDRQGASSGVSGISVDQPTVQMHTMASYGGICI